MIETIPAGMAPSPPRIKLLVVSQYQDESVGGAERYIREVCSRLPSARFEIKHLAADSQFGGLSRPIRFLSSGLNLNWPQELDGIITDYAPDVLYVHLTVPFLPEIAMKRATAMGIPILTTYHGDVTGAGLFKRVAGYLYRMLLGRRALDRASHLIVPSSAYHAASLLLPASGAPVSYLMPGVSPEFFLPVQAPDKYILFVGKPLLKSKGFSALYQAWQNLRADYPDTQLRVAGSRYCADYPDADYIGYVGDRSKLASLYNKALVTILPSATTAESFGMVLAEALAAGCPIIGSTIAGATALIKEGENGYRFVADSPQDLKRAISLSIQHNSALREHIQKSATAYAELVSWERVSSAVSNTLITLSTYGKNTSERGGKVPTQHLNDPGR